MYALRVAAVAVAGVVSLTATGVRTGNHPAYVRVVVDFNGNVSANQVAFDRLGAKTAALHIAHPGITTSTSGGTGQGVHVSLQPATQKLNIGLSFAAHRFKYVSYAVVTGNRLAIDLWKSVPAYAAKPIHTCSRLTLSSNWTSYGSTQTISVRGREHGIFENQFQVVVRDERGAILGRKTVHGPGRWKTTVHYHVTSQPGTVEAVAFSAKDGALECLAQRGVELPAT